MTVGGGSQPKGPGRARGGPRGGPGGRAGGRGGEVATVGGGRARAGPGRRAGGRRASWADPVWAGANPDGQGCQATETEGDAGAADRVDDDVDDDDDDDDDGTTGWWWGGCGWCVPGAGEGWNGDKLLVRICAGEGGCAGGANIRGRKCVGGAGNARAKMSGAVRARIE